MSIPFTKMHGLGNDYIYVDVFRHPIPVERHAPLARAMSDRHRGIGSDGLILIGPPRPGVAADVRMEMYNADGSRGEMCGNGIRCVGKYVVEHGLLREAANRSGPASRGASSAPQSSGEQRVVRIETDRGVLETVCHLRGGRVERVRVDMGPPILATREIPVEAGGEVSGRATDRCIQRPLLVGDQRLTMTCVSMGNPHAVFFVDEVAAVDLKQLGPLIERHAAFPNRVNAHFAQVVSRREAIVRTWERGSGITQACGTGACAVLVAGVLEDRLDAAALVHLPGGDLDIEWSRSAHDDGHVYKTGPAVEVYSGVWPDSEGR